MYKSSKFQVMLFNTIIRNFCYIFYVSKIDFVYVVNPFQPFIVVLKLLLHDDENNNFFISIVFIIFVEECT